MGKDKKKHKLKAQAEAAALSKKERKALEAREAELAAELAERQAIKRAKKAAKAEPPAKVKTKGKGKAEPVTEAETEAVVNVPDSTVERIAFLEGVIADLENNSQATRDKARAELVKLKDADVRTDLGKLKNDEAKADETDAAIKARVTAKREARAAHLATADAVDRDDAEAVAAYNATLAELGGGTYLTSTAEREAQAERLSEPLAAIAEPTMVVDEAKADKKAKRKAKPDEMVVEIATENGREFVAGPVAEHVKALDEAAAATAAVFARPSDAPKTDFEQNGNGQYKVQRPSDGKLVGYTRVTSYINNLESTAQLEAWKLRILLEGVATHDVPDDAGRMPDPIVVQVRDLAHRRDVAIAKARRRDRKGKLALGELAVLIEDAWKEYKRALDTLAQTALDLGGVKEAATKGTDIHALCELYDREGIDAVGDLLTEGKITPADLADVEAYAKAIERAGIKVVTEHIEQVVVNDDLKVAGRLDRVMMVRLPGSQRAARMVGDIKTGRVDYSAGKIAQQLEMYAGAKGYDLNTHERTDLKLSRTKAVLIHLPAGTGTCFIYVVDLGLGRQGNKLSGEVRAWRNEGKRAIDFSVDLAKPEAV